MSLDGYFDRDPEIGPRSVETEEHKVFSASAIAFCAGPPSNKRRTAFPSLVTSYLRDHDDTTVEATSDVGRNPRPESPSSSTRGDNHLRRWHSRLQTPSQSNNSSSPSSSSLQSTDTQSSSDHRLGEQSPTQSSRGLLSSWDSGSESRPSSRLSSLSISHEIPVHADVRASPTMLSSSHSVLGDAVQNRMASITHPGHPSPPPSYHLSSSSTQSSDPIPPPGNNHRSSSPNPVKVSRTFERSRSRTRLASILHSLKDVRSGSKSPQRQIGEVEGRSSLDRMGEYMNGQTSDPEEQEQRGRRLSALNKFSGFFNLDSEDDTRPGDIWKEFPKGQFFSRITIFTIERSLQVYILIPYL
jgi:hypothetical protein